MDDTLLQDPFDDSYTFRTRPHRTGSFPSSSSSQSSASMSINADSSPPSSPGLPASDDSKMSDVEEESGVGGGWPTLNTSPAHPFSASTHADRRPPLYAKDEARVHTKRRRSGVSGLSVVTETERSVEERAHDPYLYDPYPSVNPSTRSDFETLVWDEAIAQAIDNVTGSIDISGQDLTYIPPKISDLSKRVVFASEATSPRNERPRKTISLSSGSLVFGGNGLGSRSDEMHLFLGNNNFRYLPKELFTLDSLVVLSLRNNKLEEIPPELYRLQNLRELNVANNRLTYLPSEIMKLRSLNKLSVDQNPFEKNTFRFSKDKEQWCGPIKRLYTVPSLSELCLRVLLAPDTRRLRSSSAKSQCKTVLEALYDLPIPSDYGISPELREILSSCVPGSVTSSLETLASNPDHLRTKSGKYACVSECPSPRHLDMGSDNSDGDVAYCRPIFVGHAEERMTWERKINGILTGRDQGVPLLWRGCSVGCLDFLDASQSTADDDMDGEWAPVSMDVDDDNGSVMMLNLGGSFNPSRKDLTGKFSSEDFEFDD